MEPFHDTDVPAAIGRLSKDPMFFAISKYLWPEISQEDLVKKMHEVKTVKDFQLNFMHSAINRLVNSSSKGVSFSGLEKLDPKKPYLFIANHRDILLDSAILQVVLVENGHETSEITFGDNLMKGGFVSDLGKLNRMFTVQREGTGRELYQISKNLSEYIREAILEKGNSIWIAQRGGRTKDGSDQTQTGLLKMLNISGAGNVIDNFNALNIIPLSISYEYEPCDDFKVQEAYYSNLHTKYIKGENEDMESIRKGVLEPKGGIHLHFGEEINIDSNVPAENENAFIKYLAGEVDKQIYAGYKLWPINFIAYDMLHGNDEYLAEYSQEEKAGFEKYIDKRLEEVKGERAVLTELMLTIYANPVKNYRSL